MFMLKENSGEAWRPFRIHPRFLLQVTRRTEAGRANATAVAY
jgi:hypothetical protein